MSVLYKFFKNYTLPASAVLLAVSVVALVVSLGLLGFVANDTNTQVMRALGAWALWVTILSAFGLLVGGWYVGEQLYKRRKFERLLETDKRSDFTSSRKDLEDLARRLPDHYKPRISEKEAEFKSIRR